MWERRRENEQVVRRKCNGKCRKKQWERRGRWNKLEGVSGKEKIQRISGKEEARMNSSEGGSGRKR